MSLGVNEDVEDQIQRCVDEHNGVLPIKVAWWLFINGYGIFSSCEVGCAMLRMQEKGVLAFRDGVYVVVKQDE